MSTVELEPVIGLEIHVQLRTASKMFCGCALGFGEPPNSRTCPVCLGLPGALPVANAQAIHFGLMIGMALQSELAPSSVFHRKNYFYPDLPKGYQISQYDQPLCLGGQLGGVAIHRVHLEDDAAKLNHAGDGGRIAGSAESVVDFNRGGTPLAEIVTEPELRSAEQAGQWLRLLRTTLRALGVSDVNMEEGSLRCDANISLRPVGSTALGTKTELKNMNSFRFIERGIRAEIERQRALIEAGDSVTQETLHFDPRTESISLLRSKEEAHDYRYFPEPDLPPVQITEAMLERAAAALPELPEAREQRYIEQLALSDDSARLLSWRSELGDYFEAVLAAGDGLDAQTAANWTAELQGRLDDCEAEDSKVGADALAGLIDLVTSHQITQAVARQVLDQMVEQGGIATEIVVAEGLEAVGGADQLAPIVKAALAANPQIAERISRGEMKPIGVIIGEVMKQTGGRADGKEVTALVREQLGLS